MNKLAAWIAAGSLAFGQTTGIRGFSPDDARIQREQEAKAKSLADSARVRSYIDRMSKEPHAAGSPESRRVAEYAAGLMKEWGLDTRIEEFEALLPYPTKRVLEITAPVKYRAKLQEPVIGEDPDSGDKGQLPTYNAYSASGDVTAPVVYVNYGVPEDYEQLKKLGIDVKGKIVLARYGVSWRGTKPKVAAEHGAVACLIYSDPRDDGYFRGDIYPKGPFRPPRGVQRGSVMDMPLYVGDPLSPGWASEKGSKRLDRKDAKSVMTIPVLPISYEDAQPILENLGGPVAPEAWRGALPLTYHVGAGPATVRLAVDFDWTTKPLYNVIATIPGSEFPNEWIIYGNHHDAWVNGANDPGSGAGALLETARVLTELGKQGWRPKRTLKLALWDGEEFGLVGSTEWVEKHAQELDAKAVAYINSDSNSKGPLGLGGSPSLETFLTEVSRDTEDPITKESLSKQARPRRGEPVPGSKLGPLGAGSDYVAFVHHLGIAGANAGFSGGFGGVYHSIYDSFHWYSKFGDPDFLYGKALSEYMAVVLMRLGNATVLPFDFGTVEKALRTYTEEIGKSGAKVDFTALQEELAKLRTVAGVFEQAYERGSWRTLTPAQTGKLNVLLAHTERALLLGPGLPGRPWYRYLVSAPGQYTGYGAKTLPGVREGVELGKVEEAQQQVKAAAESVARYRSKVDEATRLLRGM